MNFNEITFGGIQKAQTELNDIYSIAQNEYKKIKDELKKGHKNHNKKDHHKKDHRRRPCHAKWVAPTILCLTLFAHLFNIVSLRRAL